MVDKKAFHFVLRWTFVHNVLLAGRGVMLKKGCGMPFPHQIKENRFAYKNFHTGSSCLL